MNIVFFTHPTFLGSQSMNRYAAMLSKGMQERAHTTDTWLPKARFFSLPCPPSFKKWFGYIDQYLVFWLEVFFRLRNVPADTLFVFTDHALGPWVPLVKKRPHVIHCHDFLAQRSALGEIPENPTGKTGQLYQAYIRRGYSAGKNFISISHQTQKDLHRFLNHAPVLSEVVYNGLNQDFKQIEKEEARRHMQTLSAVDLSQGYLLHIGGNQWYKNRIGVIELYDAWRNKYGGSLPLLLIGQKPFPELSERRNASIYKNNIHFLTAVDDEGIKRAYSGATVFIFPSLGEGFGWPIAEAMACGCPVVTTNEAPMTEIGGEAAFFIERKPREREATERWAIESAAVLEKIIKFTGNELEAVVERGIINAKRFDPAITLNCIEGVYKNVVFQQF